MQRSNEKYCSAHDDCFHNEVIIKDSKICGCINCLSIFRPSEITNWIVEKEQAENRTALCPYCGVDSVLGESSKYSITKQFLSEMHHYWFDSNTNYEESFRFYGCQCPLCKK